MTFLLFAFPSQLAPDARQVSGKQRAQEPQAAFGVCAAAPEQRGLPWPDLHTPAGPGDGPERDRPLRSRRRTGSQATTA